MNSSNTAALLHIRTQLQDDARGAVIVRCLSPTSQPLELTAGTTIGTFTSIDQQDISKNRSITEGAARCTRETWEVPEHIEAILRQACKGCATKEQEGQLAKLLNHYQTVFSKNDQDVGRTELVHQSIPTAEGTCPIWQPPHRLGPQKEQEAERKVHDLLARGMIEPANEAWSSPVVLVCKKDQSWRFCVDYRKLNAVISYCIMRYEHVITYELLYMALTRLYNIF